MPVPSTIGVQVVVSTGARAKVDSVSAEAVTIHPTGQVALPSLHWASLEEAITWWSDLGNKLATEGLRRLDARAALDEMHESLQRAGAR